MRWRARPIVALLAATLAVAAAALFFSRDGGGSRDETQVRAHAVAIGADGRAVAAVERLEQGGRWRAAVARERDDGTLDPRFGDVPLSNPAAIAVQRDGKLVVAGDRSAGGRRQLAVARLNRDGRRDPRFGDGGVVTVLTGSGDAVARAVAVEPGGSVVVVGDAADGDRHFIAVARLAGDRGRASVKQIYDASAGGTATDRSGRVLIAGTDTSDGAAVLARLRPRGGLEVERGPTRLTSASWRAVAATPDGGAVVVGSGRGPGARSLVAVQRFGPDGTVSGSAGIPAGDGDAFGSAVAVDRDGLVTVGGTGARGESPAAFVTRLRDDGTPAGRPEDRGGGRVVGLLPGGVVLVGEWDGERQRTVLRR